MIQKVYCWTSVKYNSELTNRRRGKFYAATARKEVFRDLHKSTTYCMKLKGGDNNEWQPHRGLHKGRSSHCLFSIFHQVVMRLAEKYRLETAESNNMSLGIKQN